MANVGLLPAEISSLVWGTTANFNGFRVLASLLQRHRSTKKPTKLCTMFGRLLVHYIFIFGGSCPVTEFYQVQSSLCVQVLRSPILAALLHGTRVVGVRQTAALHVNCTTAVYSPTNITSFFIPFLNSLDIASMTITNNRGKVPEKCIYSVPAQETAKHRAKFGCHPVNNVAAVTKPRRETR